MYDTSTSQAQYDLDVQLKFNWSVCAEYIHDISMESSLSWWASRADRRHEKSAYATALWFVKDSDSDKDKDKEQRKCCQEKTTRASKPSSHWCEMFLGVRNVHACSAAHQTAVCHAHRPARKFLLVCLLETCAHTYTYVLDGTHTHTQSVHTYTYTCTVNIHINIAHTRTRFVYKALHV